MDAWGSSSGREPTHHDNMKHFRIAAQMHDVEFSLDVMIVIKT